MSCHVGVRFPSFAAACRARGSGDRVACDQPCDDRQNVDPSSRGGGRRALPVVTSTPATYLLNATGRHPADRSHRSVSQRGPADLTSTSPSAGRSQARTPSWSTHRCLSIVTRSRLRKLTSVVRSYVMISPGCSAETTLAG